MSKKEFADPDGRVVLPEGVRPGPAARCALAMLAAMGRGDRDDVRAQLAEDARWWAPASAAARLPRPVEGAETASALASGVMLRSFRPGTTIWTIHHLVEQGDLVSLHMHRHAVTAAGAGYEVEYNWLFRLDRERIAEVWEIMDTSAAMLQLAVPSS